MKNLKSLITTGILAGSLVIGSCGNKELEKYNLENEKVYGDFMKFCIENPNKKEYAEKQYEINLPNNKSIDFTENNFLDVYSNGKYFFDYDGNGLDDKFSDGQTFTNKNTNLIENENIEDMPPEKQLSVAREYTNVLKEIMREEKYKNY